MKTLALWFLNRAMVYEAAMNHARKAGLDIGSSLINLGIEAALQAGWRCLRPKPGRRA